MKVRMLSQAFALLFLASACETPGICKTDADCKEFGVVCYTGQNPKKGARGICAEGERSPTGEIVAAVRAWKLLLPTTGEAEVAPLHWDKRDIAQGENLENADADWTGASGAVVEAQVLGLKPGEAVEVYTGHGLAAQCSAQGPTEGARGELWKCIFESGWNFGEESQETPEVVEVKLKPGALAEERSRTYRVDVQPPLVGLVVFSGTKCGVGADSCEGGKECQPLGGSGHVGVCPGSMPVAVGTQLNVCAEVQDTQSGMAFFENRTPPDARPIAGNPLNMGWRQGEDSGSPFVSCWTGTMPAGHNDIDAVFFSMDMKARDKAGNLWDSTSYGSFERILCSALVAEGLSVNALKAPLAYSKDQLLFGTSKGEGAKAANNSLYFFDAEGCALHSTLHTGALQGPMVVLGASGQIATALGGGGPEGRQGQRLALVTMAGALPDFVGDSSRDCVAGAGGSEAGAVFEKGLTLLSQGSGASSTDWRFAAPANSAVENASRLMLYTPHAATPGGRCASQKAEEQKLNTRFMLTPAQYIAEHEEDGETVYEHIILAIQKADKPLLSDWIFCDACWLLHPMREWPIPFPLTSLSGIALGREIWLSGDGFTGSWNGKVSEARTSPAVIDSQGRAYVVVQTSAGDYEMQRFSTPCRIGDGSCAASAVPGIPGERCVGLNGNTAPGAPGMCQISSVAPFSEAPVGSPLLGEPAANGRAEIYVVGINGTVLALDAEWLIPLWVQSLGFRVSPTAQPVLVPNPHGGGTLWVVGAQGEVRGIRVASEGLSKKADWPKAFHDNCNTSSSAVKAADMPSCF